VAIHISSPIFETIDTGIDDYLLNYQGSDATAGEIFGVIEDKTLYRYTDGLGRCFIYLRLPAQRDTLLLIGPYVSVRPSQRRIFELGEGLGISPKNMKYFEEYYTGISVVEEGSPLFVMLSAFCERIWEQPSFAMVDANAEHKNPVSPINETAKADSFDDVIVNMKAMEKRYEYENELMKAVSLGQMHNEIALISAFNSEVFEKRVTDPIRNAKNYAIIMNTLLRKSAENGGVHPVYLDRISSEFAVKIEQVSSSADTSELMRDMFRAYCRLVRKHSMKNLSSVTQKAILLIDSDLSASLSLRSIAESQGISLGYLSTVFKKDTGKTVSEYIRDKRIKHAEHLLSTTRLQVQTVALHCGIMDVQYFSKIFKKQTGKTPKEYRESIK
jgi:AraC-like DNA-binding protein